MATHQSVLTIAGQTIARPAMRTRLNRLRLSLDGDDWLEFSEFARGTARRWARGTPVSLTIDGNPVFTGRICSTHQAPRGDKGYGTGYRAAGVKWWANKSCTVTNPGSPPNVLAYNLPPRDQDYIAANAGLSVGQILGRVLDLHAAQLAAQGIAGYLPSDLAMASLAYTPVQPIYLAGKLFTAIDNLLDQWAGVVSSFVQYQPTTNDWRLRFLDSTQLADVTRTYGSDLMDRPEIDGDVSTCASRVLSRGLGHIAGAMLSVLDGTLLPWFMTTMYPTNSQAEASWNLGCFTSPDGATDTGTIVSMTGNSAVIQSDYPAAHWPTGYFAGSTLAYIYLIDTVGNDSANLTQLVNFQIVSCTAMAAGGTCTITWDPTQTAPANQFSRYRIVAQPTDGLNQCWRRYRIANPSIAAALVTHSIQPVPMAGLNFEAGVYYPMGWVDFASGASVAPSQSTPLTFRIDPATHDVVFDVPVVTVNGDPAKNAIGGSQTSGIPSDVRVFVLYNQYPLTQPYPPNDASGNPVYGGTCYTNEGLVQTEILDLGDGWSYEAGRASALQAAQAKWQTLCNTVLTGPVTINTMDTPLLTMGQRLSILGPGMPAEWNTLKAPIRAVEVRWSQSPGETLWQTTAQLNNQRRQATGDAAYVHPMYAEGWSFAGDAGLLDQQQQLASRGVGALNPYTNESNGEGGALSLPGLAGDVIDPNSAFKGEGYVPPNSPPPNPPSPDENTPEAKGNGPG